jgi:phenylacetate-coenzyme A ligase PaaK-like adenylate-forming protein
MVTPSYMLAIADELERQGVDPASTSLKIGIFGAEPWTPEMRWRSRSGWASRRSISTAVRSDGPGRRQ